MRRSRSSRLTGPAAEQLLDGHGPDSSLTWLLTAAAAPGRAEEIAGEAAARAAFAAARPDEKAPLLRAPAARRSLVSRLIAAKAVALVLLAAGATGGVALAANAQLAPIPEVSGHWLCGRGRRSERAEPIEGAQRSYRFGLRFACDARAWSGGVAGHVDDPPQHFDEGARHRQVGPAHIGADMK